MNIRDMRNALLLESRLILKSRTTMTLVAALLFFTVWAGFILPYSMALHELQLLNRAQEQAQERVQELTERYGANIQIADLHDHKNIPDSFLALYPAAGPNNIRALLAVLAPMAMAILGANIVGSEFAKRTVKVRAAHYGWANTVLIKGVAIILISFLITVTASLLGLLGGNITWNMLLRAAEVAKPLACFDILISQWQQIQQALLLVLGLSVYGILGAFVANVIRSSLGGAVVALAVPFIEARFSQLWWLPGNVYASLIADTFVYFDGASLAPPPAAGIADPLWLHWIIIAGWCVLLFFSMWGFSKRQAIS